MAEGMEVLGVGCWLLGGGGDLGAEGGGGGVGGVE